MEQKISQTAATATAIESSWPPTRESAASNGTFHQDTPATLRGRPRGRPRRDDLDPKEIARLREEERLSWRKLAQRLGAGSATVRRLYVAASGPAASTPYQNSPEGIV